MGLESLKNDLIRRSKRGLPFIMTSVVLWTLLLIVWTSSIGDILTKNLFTFCVTALLMPIAILFSKIIKAEIFIKDNPFNKLGFVLTMNQMIYLLIAMWVFPTVPEKMVMILAIIFGAHLLPFGWLYDSKAYSVMAVFISVFVFIIGIMFNPISICISMIVLEIILSIWLIKENKSIN